MLDIFIPFIIMNYILWNCYENESNMLLYLFVISLIILSDNLVKKFILNIINVIFDLFIINIQLIFWIGLVYIFYLFTINNQ